MNLNRNDDNSTKSAWPPSAWYYDHEGKDAFLRFAACSRIDLLRFARRFERDGFTCTQIETASEHRCLGVHFPCAIRVAMADGRKPAPFLLLPRAAAALSVEHAPTVVVGNATQAEGVNALMERTRHLLAVQQMTWDLIAHYDEMQPEMAAELNVKVAVRDVEISALKDELATAHMDYEDLYKLWERTDEARRALAKQLATSNQGEALEIEETPLPGPNG